MSFLYRREKRREKERTKRKRKRKGDGEKKKKRKGKETHAPGVDLYIRLEQERVYPV